MRRRAAFVFGVWLCVYPLVTGLLLGLRVVGWSIPLPLQTFIVTAILVPVMILVLTPAVLRITRLEQVAAQPPSARLSPPLV